MGRKEDIEEHLENLWYLKEKDLQTIDALKNMMGQGFDRKIFEGMDAGGLIDINDDTVSLTGKGEKYAQSLIRSHRIAERLVHDVLGGDFETGACEFEHTIAPQLVDSICTLLGHPRECPHGRPIPKGNCCRESLKIAHSSIIPLTEMQIGQTAKVAYVTSGTDQELHRLEGLHIRPGIMLKLHQTYPTFVIECEGANVAVDETIGSRIYVWKNLPEQTNNGRNPLMETSALCGTGKGLRRMFGRKRRSKH